jgi:sugar lactone lactonase YvrE
VRTYAEGLRWGEGPRWHAGALWVSDTQGSRLWTDQTGSWQATDLVSPSNGLWFLPDGTLVAVMMHQRRVGVWKDDHFDVYADLSGLARGQLGDIVGDGHGNLFLDDLGDAHDNVLDDHGDPAPGNAAHGPGRLLRVGADRSASVVADDLHFPNGLALLDQGRTLIVAETMARRLTAFDVDAHGNLGRRRLYADISALAGPEALPDGIWPADDGVWVATTAGRRVVKVREGALAESYDTTPEFPVACCTDAAGRLFVTLADTAGRPMLEAVAEKKVTTRVAVIDR